MNLFFKQWTLEKVYPTKGNQTVSKILSIRIVKYPPSYAPQSRIHRIYK